MPHELTYFFTHLFNIPNPCACNYQVNGNNIEGDGAKIMKIKSLYQISYYNLHSGKEKTPLHLFSVDSVYEKCKSREILTSLNKVKVSVSYNEVQRARNYLVRFTYFQRTNEGVPIPSYFSKDQFTIGAFDNFEHSDRSSLAKKYSNRDTVMTPFQVKPSTKSDFFSI